MEKLIPILSRYLTIEELESLSNCVIDNEVNIDAISENISPNRARYISNILFMNRKELKSIDIAIKLFSALNHFYDKNSVSELMIGDKALEPAGMCDLNNVGSYIYESQY